MAEDSPAIASGAGDERGRVVGATNIPGDPSSICPDNAKGEVCIDATAAPKRYARRPGESDQDYLKRLRDEAAKRPPSPADLQAKANSLAEMKDAIVSDPHFPAWKQGINPDAYFNPTNYPNVSVNQTLSNAASEPDAGMSVASSGMYSFYAADGNVYSGNAHSGFEQNSGVKETLAVASQQYGRWTGTEDPHWAETATVHPAAGPEWGPAPGAPHIRFVNGRSNKTRSKGPPEPETEPKSKPDPKSKSGPEPETKSGPEPRTTTGEPVSVANGEYLETWKDFLIPGVLAFDGARYLGLKLPAASGWVGPLGACQISLFDEYFSNPQHGKLDFYQADGMRIGFDRPFNFLPAENAAFPHLELTAPWLKQLRLKDRAVVKFFKQYPDRFYRLEKIEDLNGNELVFTREPSGALTEIARSDGLRLLFTNDGKGRRTSIALIGVDGARLELARYSYDALGRMVFADCAFGMSVRYHWHDSEPLLLRWHNKTRRSETVFTYDDDGRVVHTRTNGLWNDDRFRYDSEKRVTTYVPAGDVTRAQHFEYNENENVTTEIDALGGATRHTFNRVGFRTSTTDANGYTVSTTYDIWGNVKRHTDAAGRDTIYGWGPEGQLDVVIDCAGNRRRNEYDGAANVIKEIDAEGNETRYVRDAQGRIVETHFPDGAKEARAYDPRGWLSSITDAKGGVASFAYDSFGRLIGATDALGGVTRLAYDAGAGGFNTPTALTRPDGVTVRRDFDAEGALAAVSDGEGRTWRYTHGAFDVLEHIIDPRGGRLSLSYDSEGRLIRVVNANNAVYEYERDAAGRVVTETDFDGRVISYERDAAGRIIAKTAPDGSKLVYSYDPSDLLTRIDAYEPGEDGKLPEAPTSSESFDYDGRGLLIKAKNDACEVTLKRDRNGRIVEESQNHRRVVSRYDAVGRRVERALGFAQGWSADGKAPVGFQGFTAEDFAAGRIVSPYRLEPPPAPAPDAIARYRLDPLGLLEELALGPDADRPHERLRFARDALGHETKRANDRGFSLTQSFDAVGQLTGQSVRGFAGSTRYDRSFAYDKAFSPTKIVDDLWGASSYSHDSNGQVISARHGEADGNGVVRGAGSARFAASSGFTSLGLGDEIFEVERFQYDAARNVIANDTAPAGEPVNRPVTRWILSSGGKVKAARGPSGERIFLTHDGCGRVVERRIERDGFRPMIWRYLWNAFDRLIGCVTPEGKRWSYSYDPFGRRVEKRLAPAARLSHYSPDWKPRLSATRFIWDGDLIAEEIPLQGDGALDMQKRVVWHFEPGSFRPLARESASEAGEARVHYVVTDHLGTPRELLQANGELAWAASYRLWGSLRQEWKKPRPKFKYATNVSFAFAATDEDEENLCPIRFQGQWQDEETGLYYNRYRHYDPLAGQYVSPDPIGLDGGDRPQNYVGNPNKQVDPRAESGSTALVPYNPRPFLPKFDPEENVTTGYLRTLEGHGFYLRSQSSQYPFKNYSSSGHVENQAAIIIRMLKSKGGTLWHNHPKGQCNYCNSQTKYFLPEGSTLDVIPLDGIEKAPRWFNVPQQYKGIPEEPKPRY